MSERVLAIVVIYENPADYPGKFVVRRQWAHAGGVEIEKDPLAVVENLDQARDRVPFWQSHRLDRQVDDDPTIVECWI